MRNEIAKYAIWKGQWISLLLLIFLFMPGYSQLQSESPVRWRISARMLTPDEGEITIKAIVSDGWHLYGMKLPEYGPVPTTFDFPKTQGIEFLGDLEPSEQPGIHADQNFGMDLSWWEGNVSFSRKFKLSDSETSPIIYVMVRYMACNDQTCSPPRTQSLKVSVKPYNTDK